MKIVNLDPDRLAAYIQHQITHLYPTGQDPELGLIDSHLAAAAALICGSQPILACTRPCHESRPCWNTVHG